MEQKEKLKEVAWVFFKLGCVAFGGPAAHIAMMEEEVVRKRQWMARDHFLDLMGATNLIPGPNSTEMTMHCGYERAGKTGLFLAGICFIFPAVILTGILAWLYKEYGALPEVAPFVAGIKPVVLAIIASAIFKLGKKALKSVPLGILGALALIATLAGVHEILALLGAGVAGALFFYARAAGRSRMHLAWPLWLLLPTLNQVNQAGTFKVFWAFLKIGAVLYGSGYVLFAYLDAEVVTRGWLTRQQLMDAVAAGQFTPGPVLSTATFVGFQIQGVWGALAATAGIFLPSFLLVWLLNPLIPRLRQSPLLSYFLDSVNIAAVAVMVAVLLAMGTETLADGPSVIIAVMGLLLTFGPYKLSSPYLVLGGALLGYVLNWI
ncbi:chromate efflux transporter [Robiginitalea sp. M366]|uniref:chromate efflux transporter n=1 Tax=Robiginitalea aestuariiviva TaxID=3036903 RepID=UPI00240E8B6B|nr:chromate efflux transporter [Robiginitalea aestuariiviva]MDG1572464.1 chromate efflux transporter [Robiginitalea aestuariiviva]